MRAITDSEYTRMRRQAEQKFTNQTEFGYLMEYVPLDDTPVAGNYHPVHWVERGYFGDLTLSQTDRVTREATITGETETDADVRDIIQGVLRVPMRYFQAIGGAQTITQAPKGAIETLGRRFDLTIPDPPPVDTGWVIGNLGPPGRLTVNTIIIYSMYNIAPVDIDPNQPATQGIKMSLQSPPEIRSDCTVFRLISPSHYAMTKGPRFRPHIFYTTTVQNSHGGVETIHHPLGILFEQNRLGSIFGQLSTGFYSGR